jgi:predicted P-loop ATPase
MKPNPLLDAALSYAKRGWRVVPLHNTAIEPSEEKPGGECTCQEWRTKNRLGPCATPGKHPRFKDFAGRATTDEKQIREWWSTMPKANIGIITGKQSGIWALDTDPRNDGDMSRGNMQVKHGRLPDTLTARTGGGGTHEIFRWPDFDLGYFYKLDEGLEIVGEGHVLVAAPSHHHVSGRDYEWDADLGPDEIEPQEAPAYLLELIRGKMQAAAEAEASVKAGSSAPNAGNFPLAGIGKILSGCAWMRHCSDDAQRLSEPEWYAQLSILGRCRDGEALAHELSSPHPDYRQEETTVKLRRALTDTGPATCAKIKHSLGGARFCDACPNAGKVKSPVVLGIRAERPGEDAPMGEPPPEPPVHQTPKPSPTLQLVVPIDVCARVQSVIDADQAEAVYDLAALLAAQDPELLGKLKLRLRTHFKSRVLWRDFEGLIKSRRVKVEQSKHRHRPRTGARDGGGGGGNEPPVVEERWQDKLILGEKGGPLANLANAITALRFAPEWQGVLWRDEFAECTMARKDPPFPAEQGKWANLHDILTAEWLQRQDVNVTVQIAGTAVEAVAYDHKYHPPREYLTALTWDGIPRIETWLIQYLGASVERAPASEHVKCTGYLEAVGPKWLISAVARVMRPGCKADCMLVLEGEQGIKKSTALECLGGAWFTNQMERMGSKDASMQTHGKWIIEIAELGSMSKADVDIVKDFMSRQTERYRPPYASRLIEVPRQCIFGGTVNPGQYLRDDTGGRRFWPVACGQIDLEALRRDKDQIWAEARVKYDEGWTWWLDVPEVAAQAEREQAARYRDDPWEEMVRDFVRFSAVDEEVSVAQILSNCIGIPKDRWTQADSNRVVSILKALGWRRYRATGTNGARPWVYRPHTVAARLAAAKQESFKNTGDPT